MEKYARVESWRGNVDRERRYATYIFLVIVIEGGSIIFNVHPVGILMLVVFSWLPQPLQRFLYLIMAPPVIGYLFLETLFVIFTVVATGEILNWILERKQKAMLQAAAKES
jgi:hypothetical protein